ncbi:hypothetical protein Tco_1084052 [Tanacetum coccineum]
MKKDPETPLLVGRGFLATANAVIDCRKAKIAVGEGTTRSVFGVKGVDLGEEEAPYWTMKGLLDCHLPREWEIARYAEINPFKDVLVFRRMVFFRERLDGKWMNCIKMECEKWNNQPLSKARRGFKYLSDGRPWARNDPDGEEFTKTLQSIPTTRKLFERESPREIINLDNLYDT